MGALVYWSLVWIHSFGFHQAVLLLIRVKNAWWTELSTEKEPGWDHRTIVPGVWVLYPMVMSDFQWKKWLAYSFPIPSFLKSLKLSPEGRNKPSCLHCKTIILTSNVCVRKFFGDSLQRGGRWLSSENKLQQWGVGLVHLDVLLYVMKMPILKVLCCWRCPLCIKLCTSTWHCSASETPHPSDY